VLIYIVGSWNGMKYLKHFFLNTRICGKTVVCTWNKAESIVRRFGEENQKNAIVTKIVFTSFIMKEMCLWKTRVSPAEDSLKTAYLRGICKVWRGWHCLARNFTFFFVLIVLFKCSYTMRITRNLTRNSDGSVRKNLVVWASPARATCPPCRNLFTDISYSVKMGQLQHFNMCIYIYIYIYIYLCVCVCVFFFCVHLDRTKYVCAQKYFNHCTCPVLHFTNVRKCPQECHNAMFVLVLSRMYFKRSLNTMFSFVIHVGWKF